MMKRHSTRASIATMAILATALVAIAALLGSAAIAQAAPRPKPTPTPTSTSTPPPSSAKWTIMVYGDGDNNLESYLPADIDTEFSALGSNADVSVVVLADRTPGYSTADGDWTTTKLFYCTQGMTATPANAVADWGERDMGSAQTLVDFVKHVKTTYAAQHYVLVFWDHGYSWWPDWTMWDDTSANGLTLTEMSSAMASAGGVDVVAYDCCASATTEVDTTWRPYSQYVVASEDYTYAEGVAWENVIPAVRANPAMDAATMARTIGANMNDGTTSAVALDARWDTLRTAVDQWAVALTNGMAANKANYDAARKVTKYFCADATFCDLSSAAASIKAKVADATIKAKCDAVISAVSACTIYESHKTKFAGATGTTIWWPKTSADLAATDYGAYIGWTFYRTLPWSQQTAWDEFLAAYTAGR